MIKYEQLFDNAPVSIWEEDWSGIITLFDKLKGSVSSHNLMPYLNEHPEFVKELINSIKIIRINRKTVEIHEANNEKEILEASLEKTFSDKSYVIFKEEMVALYRGDTQFEMEAELSTLRGNPLYVIIQIKLPEVPEDYSNVTVIMVDITPSKRTHKKYLESKAKFHLAFYQGVVGMALLDIKGKFLEVNDSFCEFTGYNREELVNQSVFNLENESQPLAKIYMDRLLNDDHECCKGECQLKRKDGTNVWALVGLNMVKDEFGNPIYFIGQVVDIDSQKRSAIIQEQNVIKYQQLLDSTSAIYLILDDEGNINEYSNNFLEFFGNKSDKKRLNHKPLRAFIDTNSISTFDEAWKLIIQGQTLKCVEIALMEDKCLRWVSMNASLFKNGGRKIFILLTDITERKRKEFERLIVKEKHRDKLRNNIRDLRETMAKKMGENDYGYSN